MNELEIKITELLNDHPKSYEVITNYFLKMMINSFDTEEVPEEFKEAMRNVGIEKERLIMIISGSPRSLFDVFDENDIFIEVYRTNGNSFTFNIEGYLDHPGHYDKRKDCEIEAIEEAIKLLESKL